MTIAILIISCSEGTSTNSGQYSSKPNNSTSSTNYSVEETSQVSERTNNSEKKNNKTVGNEISRICNTKWTFTDSKGYKYVLKIDGVARDGESARAELIKEDGGIDYATVVVGYRGWGDEMEFDYYRFNESAYTHLYFPSSNYSVLDIMRWDYDNGYLYKNVNAFESESPVDRLVIKKTK